MTPQARVAAAIALLEAIAAEPRPADKVAGDFMRARRYIGAKDRRAILDRIYGVIRHREALDWWIARAGAAPSARTRILAWLGLGEKMTAEAIAASFTGATYAAGELAGQESGLVRRLAGQPLDHPEQPPRIAANCPEWIARLLARRFGARFLREMFALNEEAPLDLRVNALKGSRVDAVAALEKAGIAAEPTRTSPWGLRLSSRQPIAGLSCYKRGLVEIQDEGSQIAALLADARCGQTVVDFCAGGGGKALALAAAMKNKGEIAALDVSPRIMAAAPRIKRAGASIVALHRLAPRDPWLARYEGRADRVFVDAPCTGVGAWRRDPSARFRLTRAELERLIALQREILAQAAGLVKAGGRLIYVTCSLLAEEDEDQAAWFLDEHRGFAPIAVSEVWAEIFDGPSPAQGPYLLLTPALHGTDGFFVSIFEREKR